MNASDSRTEREQMAMEQRSLWNGASFAELGDYTHLSIRGRDRATFLHGMCTQWIRELAVGQGCEAFVTNVQGKIIGHIWMSCHDDHFSITTSPGQGQTLARHFDKYIIREDVQIQDDSAQWGYWLVAGPAAREKLNDLFDVERLQRTGDHCDASWEGEVCRLRYFHEEPSLLQLWAPLWRAESFSGWLKDRGLLECSAPAAELWRIEAGLPLYGTDISIDNLAQEVDRNDTAISFTKGCYLGQETVARLDALGHVNRRRMGLTLPGEVPWDPGTEIIVEGKVVAKVTSSAYSPRHEGVIGMGYVRRGWDQPGQTLETPGGSAIVQSLPFQAP